MDLQRIGDELEITALLTGDGWRSRSLREENVWFINSPGS
jgi:hypothetical protein